jgi:hypothetical protein
VKAGAKIGPPKEEEMSKASIRGGVLCAIVLGVAAGAVALIGPAWGTPPATVTTQIMAHGTTTSGFKIHVGAMKVSAKGRVDFTDAHLTFAPGGTTGWHVHPGPVLVIVRSGAVTRYSADCKPEVFSAGQGFVERGPKDVNMVRNNGSVPAETEVEFITPVGAAPRIDTPAPKGCNP